MAWYNKLLDVIFLMIGLTPTVLDEPILKWGENIDVDIADATAGQVIWPIKSTVQQYLFLDAPTQLYIESSDALDNPSGTGARSVTITNWHGADGNKANSVELPTNGLGQTALPELSYGVFSFEIEDIGTGKTNAGVIDIVDGSANIYARILVGEGRTQIAVQRIPNNKKAKVVFHKCDYARTGGAASDAEMRLRQRKANGAILTRWDPTLGTNKPDDTKDYKVGGLKYSPGEWVYWECVKVSAADTPLRGSFDIVLEDA